MSVPTWARRREPKRTCATRFAFVNRPRSKAACQLAELFAERYPIKGKLLIDSMNNEACAR